MKTSVANRWELRLNFFEGEEIISTMRAFETYSLTLQTEEVLTAEF